MTDGLVSSQSSSGSAPDEVRRATRLTYTDNEGYGSLVAFDRAADVAYAAGLAAGLAQGYADDTRHILEIHDGDWSIRHPRNCHPDFPCTVQQLGEKRMDVPDSFRTGRYYCWDDGNYLMVGGKVQ